MNEQPAVKLWRDKFNLNLSASWKRDVAITVQDLDLWREILDGWFYFDAKGKKRNRHPGIKNLLTEYERRVQNIQSDHQAPVVSARGRAGLSQRGDSDLQTLRIEAPSCYFRVDRMDAVRLSKVRWARQEKPLTAGKRKSGGKKHRHLKAVVNQ